MGMSLRMRIVLYYAIWATLCAAVAGTAVALIHLWFFSDDTGGNALMQRLLGNVGTALALAAGQGVVAFLAGALLARVGRGLTLTVLLGLALGLFDFVMYIVQMVVPETELGWGPDLLILAAVTVAITALGSRRESGA